MSRRTWNPIITEIVGKAIRARRKLDGRSQNQLAADVGVGSGTMSRYESGLDHGPSVGILCELADALDCEPGELLPSLAEIREALYGKRSA